MGVRYRSQKVGMLISGQKTDSVYRRYNIIDMEEVKTGTNKIEEHQREIVKTENSHNWHRKWCT
jgi:hypothetical protein